MGERAALNNSSSRSRHLKMKLEPGVNFFYITPQLGQQEANRVSDTVSNMGLKRSPSSIIVNRATGMGLKKKKREKHIEIVANWCKGHPNKTICPLTMTHLLSVYFQFVLEASWLAVRNPHPKGIRRGRQLKQALLVFFVVFFPM